MTSRLLHPAPKGTALGAGLRRTSSLAATALSLGFLLALAPGARAQETGAERHGEGPEHPGHRATMTQVGDSPLREPGNAAFAAVQEVVRELRRREDTDWSRVDLEALRRHLRDMQRFTVEAEVVERDSIEGGLRVAVTGPDPETIDAVRRALHAHASMLRAEEGWSVEVEDRAERTVLSVTGSSPAEAAEIRGLGYIGLMATGAHHRRHHWMIATGRAPHGG